MKKLFGAFLFSLLLIQHTGAQTGSDRESEGLKGPVKSVRLKTAEISQRDGKAFERISSLEILTTYDENGNKTEESRYSRGSLLEKTTYARDDKGTQTKIRYQADGKMIRKSVAGFDEQGKPTGSNEYDANGVLQSKSVYTYDAQGKFLEAAIYNADGSLKNKTIFKHDAAGKQVGLEVYDASGKLLQQQSQSETENTSTVYGTEPADTRQFVNRPTSDSEEFDAHGNWIKKSTPVSVNRLGVTEKIIEVIYREITYY
jgi:hypothetical protein